MAISKGKEFEHRVQEQIEELFPEVDITRLYDTTNGYKNIKNPSDFIAYCKPTQYYLETKSTQEGTLNFSAITQLQDLKNKSKIDGILAGVIVWYVKHKKVFWVDVRYIEELEKLAYKSLNIKNLIFETNPYVYEIPSETSRVYPKMSFKEFFNNIK